MAVNERVSMRVPAGKVTLGGNEQLYVMDCLRLGQLSMGGYVRLFEQKFAAYLGVKHAVAVCNGTAALHLALKVADVGPGDEVIVPALTFVATANAVAYCGATPVVVDVEPDTWCMDPVDVVRAMSWRTKAILPVHLYGVPAAMDPIRQIADGAHIPVIEDAAEALGAECGGVLVGGLGDMACFSFYGNKTITTGEGGMVVTNDDHLADRLRLLRGQAQTKMRYWHEEIGFNYRMTEMQAAVGVGQLENIDLFLSHRRRVMATYRERLPELLFQKIHAGDAHGAWATAVLLPDSADRDEVIDAMAARGVETRPVFYPVDALPMYRPPHNPVATLVAKQGIVLPTYPGLSDEAIQYVCETLREALNNLTPPAPSPLRREGESRE